VRRIITLALAGAGALALPAAASAATAAALDKACYVAGQPGTLALFGFSPNAPVSLTSTDLPPRQIATDATGSSAIPFTPPAGTDLARPGSREIAFTATEVANPANTATARSRIAPLAFATDKGVKSPTSKRSWYFSGWTVGRPIYAHFRFGGRTKGTYKFGKATGPCGEYKRRAPGIAIKGRVPAGTWTIQVDQSPSYSPDTQPSLKDKTVVFTRFRQRSAVGAAALSTAALAGSYRFGGFAAGL